MIEPTHPRRDHGLRVMGRVIERGLVEGGSGVAAAAVPVHDA